MSIKLTFKSLDPVAKYAPSSEKATLHTGSKKRIYVCVCIYICMCMYIYISVYIYIYATSMYLS